MNDRAQNHTATIAECITQLLKKMQIDATVEEGLIGDTVTLTVRTPEAGLLIGDEGQHLFAFNYLLKKIVERQLPEAPHFIVDVNDYQRRRFEELRDQARMGAQRVRYFKKEVMLDPMTAYERRLVHLTLQEYPDITTESTGTGPERKVVIKPYP